MSKENSQDDKFVFNKHSNSPDSQPHQHRCNGHLEDALEGLSQWPLDFSKPFGLFLSCLKSQPDCETGQEPVRYKFTKEEKEQ